MNKERVVETVKEWMQVDNEMKTIQKRLRELRQDKKELTDILIDIMRNNDIDEFDVNGGGKIMYKKSTVKSTLSKKHLLASLHEYFKDNPEQGIEVTNFILENREEKVKESIKRTSS